jgi:hypothetical protein
MAATKVTPRRRPPLAVRVAGRWHQGLAAIVVMFGLAAAEFAVKYARASPGGLIATMGAFVALAAVLFVTGQGLLRGRRWAWRAGVISAGTLLVVLFYAVTVAPAQPMLQWWLTRLVTLVLFGTPVVLLGLPSALRFFAQREE